MLPTVAGILLLTPNVVALVGFAGLFVALEIQTRLVEEPYLLRTHGESYATYARRVGRFVPGLGRLRSS
jgi:protein-S-isoprenylcysteine O-methyltransferase Ste14